MTVGDHPLPNLRFDGVQDDWLQFTELDASRASYGASFYVHADNYDLTALDIKRQSKLHQFSEPVAQEQL